jgi:ABC-2 type transport system ATP-binding protein
MTTTATVRLTRAGRVRSGGKPWEVVLDGAVVDSLDSGEEIDVPVVPGTHALRVRAGKYLASPERSFETGDGRIVGFSCRTRPQHPFIVQRSLFLLIASLFTHQSWIALTPDEDHLAEAPEPGTVVTPASLLSSLPRQSSPPADSGAEPVLVVDSLTKRFGRRTAFSEVSFKVFRGEVFGFLGPNGAGKTTTVRTLGTLIAPTSGSATVAGIPLAPENGVEIRQRVSIMPEAPGLYLRLTVAENLEYFAGLYGLHHPETRIAEALDAVNLGDRAGDLCGGLSKGLRQRVGLARTLLSDPAIMFLDEPTSGLDPVAAREVHDLVDGLRERGVTIFLTTHRLDEAEKLCDRVAILNTTLRTIGRPADLRAQLFKSALIVETLKPLVDPDALFASLPAVESWSAVHDGTYEVVVADPRLAAPEVARSLVGAGADVVSIGEAQHSLEDVYLELINEDVEARKQ